MKRTATQDPKGRVDLLILRLAEHGTKLLEREIARRARVPDVSLWPVFEPLVKREIRRRKIPARALNASQVAKVLWDGHGRGLRCTG